MTHRDYDMGLSVCNCLGCGLFRMRIMKEGACLRGLFKRGMDINPLSFIRLSWLSYSLFTPSFESFSRVVCRCICLFKET